MHQRLGLCHSSTMATKYYCSYERRLVMRTSHRIHDEARVSVRVSARARALGADTVQDPRQTMISPFLWTNLAGLLQLF